jgi:hypothetical protein
LEKTIEIIYGLSREQFDTLIDLLLKEFESVRKVSTPVRIEKIIKSFPKFDDLLFACRARLIDEYLSAVDMVNKEKGKQSPKEFNNRKKEYLRELLSPLIQLAKLDPSGENPLRYDRTQFEKVETRDGPLLKPEKYSYYPFVSEFIWLEKEIDIENLNYNRDKYRIDVDEGRPIRPGKRGIFIKEEFRKSLKQREESEKKTKELGMEIPPRGIGNQGYFSLNDLYKKWLPQLSFETIQNNDLLDQILLCYTIKRALNGDNEAIDKLFGLFEKRVITEKSVKKIIGLVAYQLYREFKREKYNEYKQYFDEEEARKKAEEEVKKHIISIPKSEDKVYSRKRKNLVDSERIISSDDIKQTSLIFLRLIIGGFSPEYIISNLFSDEKDFYISPAIVDFFLNHFSDHVPKEINKTLTLMEKEERTIAIIDAASLEIDELDEIKQECIRATGYLGLKLNLLLNPYTPIRDNAYSLSQEGKSSRVFNDFCYYPNQMGSHKNLTLWLFGPRGKPQYGKLNQILRDCFLPKIREEIRSSSFDHSNEYIEKENNDNTSYEVDPLKKRINEHYMDLSDNTFEATEIKEEIEDIKYKLKKNDMSQRDIEIFLLYIFREDLNLSQKQIAARYELSDRQVRNICKRAETILS